MKSKLFKEFIAEQSPSDRYYKRGSAEARSTEAERARQFRQQTQQSVTDYASKQGLSPSDVINQVRPFSDVPTVKKPGDLPPDVERAARLLSDPKTNWRDLSKPDPVLPPGAVGNIINALPPNIGPVPVRGPATFLRSLITPKVSKPLSVTPEIGIPPPMSRGITSQTSGDIAAGIAKAEKAARDRAGVSSASTPTTTRVEPSLDTGSQPAKPPKTNKASSDPTTSKPATNEPVTPVQGQTATTSTPKKRLYEPEDLEKKFADIRAGRDARTQQTPEPPANPPTTNKASSDPNKSTRVEPSLDLDAIDSAIAASKAGTAKNTNTAPAPASLRYRDYGSREGMAPRLPGGNAPANSATLQVNPSNVKTASTANEPSRGYGRGAIALGISGTGVAALNQPPVSSAASQTNPRTNTASTTARPAAPAAAAAAPAAAAAAPAAPAASASSPAAPAASASSPAAPAASASSPAAPAASASSPAAPAASASSPAAPAPGRSSTPAAAASAPVVAPFGSGPPDTRLLINPPPAAPVTKAAPAPPADTNTGQIVTDLVNQARAETPFRISDQEQKQRELDREQTRAKAMDFLSKGNVGINPDAWTDKDKLNLAKMQGQGIQESIQELKKLSGLVK